MSDAKHTPGPWIVGGTGRLIVTPDLRESGHPGWKPERKKLANVLSSGCIGYVDLESAEANARLIAAAPDLLATIQPLIAIGDHRWRALPADSHEKKSLAAAKAAVAKAISPDVGEAAGRGSASPAAFDS